MLTSESRQRDFPWLREQTYLNTAAEGIMPISVVQALHQYAEDKQRGMDGRVSHDAQWIGAKEQIARAYGLSPDEVTICSCTSDAFNLAAQALQLRDTDEVIINDLDFPSGATPWLQPSCPATVKLWHSRDLALHVEDLIPLLGPRTRLVSTSLVSYYNGYKLQLDETTDAIRKHSPALIALDVTQALGRIPLHLEDIDFIVSSTHKWILANHGGGLVGIPARRAKQWTVPVGGWFNLKNAFDADRFDRVETKSGAGSFTVGMPNYAAAYAVNAGLSYVQAVGIHAINSHCRPLMDACYNGLKALSVDVITPSAVEQQAGIIAFRHPRSTEIVQILRQSNIHILFHSGRLRVSMHGYNTINDVEHFLKTLRDVCR